MKKAVSARTQNAAGSPAAGPTRSRDTAAASPRFWKEPRRVRDMAWLLFKPADLARINTANPTAKVRAMDIQATLHPSVQRAPWFRPITVYVTRKKPRFMGRTGLIGSSRTSLEARAGMRINTMEIWSR